MYKIEKYPNESRGGNPKSRFFSDASSKQCNVKYFKIYASIGLLKIVGQIDHSPPQWAKIKDHSTSKPPN